MSPAYFQVAFVHILQQEEDYRDEESLINRALQIAIRNLETMGSSLSDEEFLAYHEAGHAVVAWTLGLPVGDVYEPTLTAATKNLGDRVEISIRDNGTGISPEVKEKLFSPFFTTKPAGEGTGLGLSISHDIIVKQHGGSIEVDSKRGEFTKFRIVLPRTGASLIKSSESGSR